MLYHLKYKKNSHKKLFNLNKLSYSNQAKNESLFIHTDHYFIGKIKEIYRLGLFGLFIKSKIRSITKD